jgi:hypothetical protein
MTDDLEKKKTMKTLSDYFGKTLLLVQPSIMKRVFELRDGNEIIGTLTYPKFFSVQADVKIFDTKWEFYEPRWWRNIIEIREAGKELPIASYKPPSFKRTGKLELPQGESISLSSTFFRTTLEISDKYNSRLIMFKSKFAFKSKVEVLIEKRSDVLDKHPWVVWLIYYVLLNQRRRSSSG